LGHRRSRAAIGVAAWFSVNSLIPTLTNQKRRPWRGLALRLLGSAVVLGVLVWVLPFTQLKGAVARVSIGLWLALLAGFLATHSIGFLKWRMFVNLAGAGLDARTALRCYLGGVFGILFLPSVAGGDLLRAGMALRHGQSKAGVLLGSLVDRTLDTLALAVVAGVGAFLVPGELSPESRRVFEWVLGGFAAMVALALLIAWGVARRGRSFRLRRRIVKVRMAVRALSGKPQYVAAGAVMALAFQTCFVLLGSTLGRACGIDVPLRVWLFAWPLAKIAALVPVTQGGIGVREAALAGLLAPFGVAAATAVGAGLVWQSVVMGAAVVGGLALLWVKRSGR
jgi:uncharacterized membrane protein YbhN (UPF0104 family)